MAPLAVRLFDDQLNAQTWSDELKEIVDPSVYQIQPVPPEEFASSVEVLARRRKAVANGEASDEPCVFDHAQILIVDYDLTYLNEGEFLTGEHVAYLARCFSSCGVIVAVNRFRAGFDLSLAGHADSFADVHVRAKQLTNVGLWKEESSGFCPWSWPILSEEVAAFERRVNDVTGRLDRPILDHLDLGRVLAVAPRPVLEYLDAGDAGDVTFEQFVRDGDNGARVPGPLPEHWTARVAASRIGAWVWQVLVPLQDVLIDAPHLATRARGLMARRSEDEWQRLAARTASGNTAELLEAAVPARLGSALWTRRPTWDWSLASEIAAEFRPRDGDPVMVFCEDLSRFVPPNAAKTFVAELATPYRRRYVFDPTSELGKQMRSDLEWVNDPAAIDYRPAVRYAL